MKFKFSDLDVFPKVRQDYIRQTTIGGFVTVTSICIMFYLFLHQTISFFGTPLTQRLRVDETPLPKTDEGILDYDNQTKLKINFYIKLHSFPCAFIDIGVLDDNKEEQEFKFIKFKLRSYSKEGRRLKRYFNNTQTTECGNCYGASSGCCNTCKSVKKAFKSKNRLPPPIYTIDQCKEEVKDISLDEKCDIIGNIQVLPVPGILYIAPGDSYSEKSHHTADYAALNLTVDDFNFTNTIRSFSFGPQERGPMDGLETVQTQKGRLKSLFFVRAARESKDGNDHYRLSISKFERYREGTSGKFPGIFIYYDVSPVIAEYKRDVSVLHFLVDLMAILGGVFSIASFVERILMKLKSD
ncbi:endoplasmic reticulum-Golgi intermediate compartment protein 3-like [Histomonas meleagridis]|uniref:endoplasmic reticulum-Golgi intermediate compartment protein 3-like n=1 Tax=Histomonas meleagridis TaxID=135588 RepID=UPI003559E042|nr:endoplasmic reticulum-Golgi intermediate compartment protein 3-like [Histomonas meleagridis]KAH0806844.1 endoplasmic reticulum-Golgi intermediate compartment protein 3-like [Histomonas meleagridis]